MVPSGKTTRMSKEALQSARFSSKPMCFQKTCGYRERRALKGECNLIIERSSFTRNGNISGPRGGVADQRCNRHQGASQRLQASATPLLTVHAGLSYYLTLKRILRATNGAIEAQAPRQVYRRARQEEVVELQNRPRSAPAHRPELRPADLGGQCVR